MALSFDPSTDPQGRTLVGQEVYSPSTVPLTTGVSPYANQPGYDAQGNKLDYVDTSFSPVISSQGAQIKLDKTTSDVDKFMVNAQTEFDKSALEQQDLMKKQDEYLNNLLAQQTEQFKATTEQAIGEREKLGQRALKGFGAQAALSGGQFASSTFLDLNAIDMETQTAVQDLRSKRDQAIQTAQQAIAEKKVGLAESAFKEARQAQKDLLDRQKEGIAMRSQLVTQARADQTAAQTEANRVRDDARTVINSVLSNFGGASLENIPTEMKAQFATLEKQAGLPNGFITSGLMTMKEKTLTQQKALAEERLADKQQQDSIMNAIRFATLGKAQTREQRLREQAGDNVKDLQAQLDNYVLDKNAGREVPLWAEQFLVPEAKGGEVIPNSFVAKKLTKENVDEIQNFEVAQQQKQLQNPDYVYQQIKDDRFKGAGYEEIKQAAIAAGVTPEVFRAALQKFLEEAGISGATSVSLNK